jgi:nucleotide-binding universal stress UspA family protein
MQLFLLRSVLVASDLGELSLPAVRTAIDLARLAGARLHLLHVGDTMIASDDESRLRDHARRAAPGELKGASMRVVMGSPSTAIVEHATRVDADVIVLGPHRRDSPSAAFGSTATAVVDAASCPCLIVAGNLRLPLERVMVPIDLSESGGGSLAVAVTWASALRPRNEDADLSVLHVSTGAEDHANGEALHLEVERIRAWAGGAARVRLRERVISSADPASEILERAAEDAADLVVMGTGANAAERDTAERRVGRVTRAVIRNAPCPVLVVPPRVWRSQGMQ